MSTEPDTGPDGLGVTREYVYMGADGEQCEEQDAVAFWWTGYDSAGNQVGSGSGRITPPDPPPPG